MLSKVIQIINIKIDRNNSVFREIDFEQNGGCPNSRNQFLQKNLNFIIYRKKQKIRRLKEERLLSR